MSFASSAEINGMQDHQKIIDAAGNNPTNVNSSAFKTDTINFSELLSETIKKASQSTSNIGGDNIHQMDTGVGVSGISSNMTQGSIVNTGNPLDLALEGEGYFVLNNGQQDIFTRGGAFAVDANSIMIDPATGYRVQRIGSVGENDGFQVSGDSNLHVPYGVPIPAQLTSTITISGNLSADATLQTAQIQVLGSNTRYTTKSAAAVGSTLLSNLDQYTGTLNSGTITFSGYKPDGSALGSNPTTNLRMPITSTTTLNDVLTWLNTDGGTAGKGVLGSAATASLHNGQLRITDTTSGYSKSDLAMTYSGDGTFTMPGYFEMLTVGGDEVKNVNIMVYDSKGEQQVFSGAFVRTNTPNTWDMVLSSISGNINQITIPNRRIENITFDNTNGYYTGVTGSNNNPSEFVISFGHDPLNPQAIALDFGAAGQFNGLTQFAGNSTAIAEDQDGYETGQLSSVSVNNEGIVIGAFSNGIKKDIGAIQISLFKNTSGLESIGSGYFTSSANSGAPVATQAMSGGAGSVHGGALEKSNSDVANQFVSMIQAQNGFQTNVRTIQVANDILQELSNFIR
jgi:flagellar hook protein FlgE